LVILEEMPPRILEPFPGTVPSPSVERFTSNEALTPDASIVKLQLELRAKDESLQSAYEELRTSLEELKSSNEEMHSVNEELQSTNEELETSKEEMQSVNEELSTVNAELQNKVTELSRANQDMNNLLAGTGIGIVYVDSLLRILRFTPAATRVINLIPGDVGRPVGHLVSNLVGYDRIVADTKEVLNSMAPKEVEVLTQAGEWFTLRILPYRNMEKFVEGAVITFTDITEMRKMHARDSDGKQPGLEVANSPKTIPEAMESLRLEADAGARTSTNIPTPPLKSRVRWWWPW